MVFTVDQPSTENKSMNKYTHCKNLTHEMLWSTHPQTLNLLKISCYTVNYSVPCSFGAHIDKLIVILDVLSDAPYLVEPVALKEG